jgi:hypothetical protein
MRQLLKGVSFHMLRDFVREVLGEGVFGELLDELSPEARETFSGEISKASWYPLDHYSELEGAIVKRFFRGDITYARKIASFTMERAYENIYRLAFITIKNPKDAIATITQIWSLYNIPGRVEVEELGEGRARCRLSGTSNIPDIHKEHLCGWVEKLLEKVGAKDPHVTWKQDGADVVFGCRWEEPED